VVLFLAGIVTAQQQPPAPDPKPVLSTADQVRQALELLRQQTAAMASQQAGAPEPAKGEGIDLEVQAVDAATGAGLPGASIELSREPVITSAQAAADRRRWSYRKTTDERGKAIVSGMVADRYSITPTLKGYGIATGSLNLVSLTAASKPSSITIRMWKASVVEGVVEDRDHNPLADASVEILEEGFTGGLRTLAQVQPPIRTDKTGNFSFPAILPGTYYLRAIPPQPLVQQQLRDSSKAPERNDQRVAFVDTIYPNAKYMEEAAAITVYPGINQLGLRIEMQKANYFSFSGRVFGVPTDQISPGLVLMRRVGFDSPFPFIWSSPYANAINLRLAPDGSFTAANIPPGPYWAGFTPAGAVRGGAQFEIVDRDIADFRIDVSEGARFFGTAVYEDGTPAEPGFASMGVFQPAMGVYMRDFQLNQKGEFSAPGLPTGTYRLEFPSGSAVVKKIEIDGRTFPGGEFDLSATSGAAVMTLSRSGGTINGEVEMVEQVRAYPRGMVTIVPDPIRPTDTPKRKRLEGVSTFTLDHLEAGRYRVCAWLEEGAEISRVLGNPRFDRQLGSSCETIKIEGDENKQVRLKQASALDFK